MQEELITADPQHYFITASEQQCYRRLSDSKTSIHTVWMMFLGATWVQRQHAWLTREGFSPIPPRAGLEPLSNCRLSPVRSDKEPQRTKCLSHLPESLMRDCEEACQCDNNYRNCTIQQLQASHPLHTSVAFGKAHTHTHTQAATLNRSATTTRTFPS